VYPPALAGYGRCWSSVDLLGSTLRSGVYRLDPFDIYLFSSAALDVLVGWSCGALIRLFFDFVLQQVWPGSREGGVIMAARLQLALVLVVVSRWSTDMDVIFVISVLFLLPWHDDRSKVSSPKRAHDDRENIPLRPLPPLVEPPLLPCITAPRGSTSEVVLISGVRFVLSCFLFG
jgi:hypothetical protein